MILKKILKEPLFHFSLLGSGLFLIAEQITPNRDKLSITVSNGEISHIKTIFKKKWLREPSQEELKGIINKHIEEKIGYLEGVSMGFDKEDVVIKRRVKQKLDVFIEDSQRNSVTEQDIKNHYTNNLDSYRSSDIYSFKHVYAENQKQLDKIKQQISLSKQEVPNDVDQSIVDLGTRGLFKNEYQKIDVNNLQNMFGKTFTTALSQVKHHKWQGPVISDYGLHFVKITRFERGKQKKLAEVSHRVLIDLQEQSGVDYKEKFYSQLKNKYNVKIEW